MDKEFVSMMKGRALNVLRQCAQDGQDFSPVVGMLEGDKATLIMAPWKNNEEKRKMLQDVVLHLGENGLSECLVITDAYLRKAKSLEEGKFIEENWDTEQPSLYPKNLQREALVLTEINLKDSTQESLEFIEYIRNDPNVVITGEEKGEGKEKNLQISGEIKDSIINGFLLGVAHRLGLPPKEDFFAHLDKEYPDLVIYMKTLYRC